MNSEPKDVTVADPPSAPDKRADPTVRVIKGFLSSERPPADKTLIGTGTPFAFAELRTLRAAMRHALAGRLIPAGVGNDEVVRRLAIVATELAANAMAHTGPPTTVRLFRAATTYIVDVADNNPWLAAQGTGERFAGAGGLGLRMARKLSLRMGWYTDAGIRHVWAEIGSAVGHRTVELPDDAPDPVRVVSPSGVHAPRTDPLVTCHRPSGR
jgi:serine/threonine-protein kinase RsbW